MQRPIDFDRLVLLVIGVGSLMVLVQCEVSADAIYLNENCDKEITVASDVVIFWARTSDPIPDNTDCKLLIKLNASDPNNQLVGQFDTGFIFNSDYDVENCTIISLQIEINGTKQFGPHGHCRDVIPKQIRTGLNLGGMYNQIQFGYKTGHSSSSPNPGNFSLVVTSAFYKDNNADCPLDYFNCQKDNKCVKNSVVCNGWNDCGNYEIKDEAQDCLHDGNDIDLAPIIAVPCAAAVGGILGVGLYTLWKKKRGGDNSNL